MKDFFIDLFRKPFLWIIGFFTSVGFEGISKMNHEAMQTTREIMAQNQEPLMRYFWIGILGVLGGLVIKILWGCMKRAFPKLKNIDK